MTPTSQYPTIEALIESESFDSINAAFERAYTELEALASKKSGLKKGRDAEKVMAAIDEVMGLLKELLQLKFQMKEASAINKTSAK